MQHVQLGSTGLSVSRLCLGTMTFGLQTSEETSRAILDKAAGQGIDFIDTADVYPLGGDLATVGRTEEILGRWLKGQRENFIVATKGVARMGHRPWDMGASRKHILSAVDASLRRLGTDHVDIYQLHSDDPNTPIEEAFAALDTIVQSGRARYVGVSNFLAWRLATAIGQCRLQGWARPVTVQPRYNLLFRENERELLPLAAHEALGVLAYNPLAGGMLTGKHRSMGLPPAGSRFALGTAAKRYQERYWQSRMIDTVQELERATRACGVALPMAAVAWVLANPVVTSAIVGASSPEQLDGTLGAASMTLDPGLKSAMDDMTSVYRWGDAPM